MSTVVELPAAPFQLLNDGAPCSTEADNVCLDVVPAVSSSVPIMLLMSRQPPPFEAVVPDVARASAHMS